VFRRFFVVARQIAATPCIAHNKIMIIAGRTRITGSFNFTKGAQEKS
jgi:phosphatidylserine/phosphatidylglycerophosphate/cardiolipin synthase-like enzyme